MKKGILIVVLIAVSIASLAFSFYVNQKVDRVVVIDVIKVVNEFNLKKELEGVIDGKLNVYTEKIDSLTALLEAIKSKNDQAAYNVVEQQLNAWKEKGMSAYEISNQSINEQVWKRLNPLIDEFGKQNSFRIIIGANGMGTVLYQDGTINKTDELIKFINENYAKGSD